MTTLRFPVFWLTVVVFGVVAAATMDVFVGGFTFFFVLPIVLLVQWCVRWVFRRSRHPVWLRRGVMLLPALVLAVWLFRDTNSFGGSQSQAVRVALAGHTPAGMRDLHVQEDAWTDYVVLAYFQCDPGSLRHILERPPFEKSHYQPRNFSFAMTPFSDLQVRPDLQDIVVYDRTDLEAAKGRCTIYTDSTFSFAYIIYGVD